MKSFINRFNTDLLTPIVLAFLTLCSVQILGQSSCDSLTIVSVHYWAVDSGTIEVRVENQSTEIFSYPSFVLYNTNGDTLAKETVNFFGIGGGIQSHFLTVQPGVVLPTGPFNGVVELFGGFGDTLFCSWNTVVDLCPATTCQQAEIYITNLGTLTPFAASWTVYDAMQQAVATGTIWMDTVSHTHFDTVCLTPGNYEIEIIGFFQPSSQILLGITDSYYSSIGTNTAQQNDTTYEDLSFQWYTACSDGTNSIEQATGSELHVSRVGDELFISNPSNERLGDLMLVDMHGREVMSRSVLSDQASLNIQHLPAGLYILRSFHKGRVFTIKLAL